MTPLKPRHTESLQRKMFPDNELMRKNYKPNKEQSHPEEESLGPAKS
jgi:hypothetical protein